MERGDPILDKNGVYSWYESLCMVLPRVIDLVSLVGLKEPLLNIGGEDTTNRLVMQSNAQYFTFEKWRIAGRTCAGED